MDTFDLTNTPDRIGPQYGFIGLFLIIGIGVLLAAWMVLRLTNTKRGGGVDRLRRLAWFMVPFGVIWIGFTSYMGVGEIQSARATRESLLKGNYRTLEGCLDYFRPGDASPGRSTAGDEKWSVNGHAFRYGAGELRFAYHKVEPLGGLVHRRSKVRVSFVHDDFLGRDHIVRLEVVHNSCPAAPDAPRD